MGPSTVGFRRNDGIWNRAVEYDFPRWDFLLACPAPRHPSTRVVAFGRPPLWIPLWTDAWKLGRQAKVVPAWKAILHRGISNPTVSA